MPPASKLTAPTLSGDELFSEAWPLPARWHVGSLPSLLPSLRRLDAAVCGEGMVQMEQLLVRRRCRATPRCSTSA
jgi:hypothetical protein